MIVRVLSGEVVVLFEKRVKEDRCTYLHILCCHHGGQKALESFGIFPVHGHFDFCWLVIVVVFEVLKIVAMGFECGLMRDVEVVAVRV